MGISNYQEPFADIRISPNPITQSAIIQYKSESFHVFFELYDMFDQLVKRFPLEKSETLLERGNLRNGVYHFRIILKNDMIATGKIIFLN